MINKEKKQKTLSVKTKQIPKCNYCGKNNFSISKYGFCSTSCRLNALYLVNLKKTEKLSKKQNELRNKIIEVLRSVNPNLKAVNSSEWKEKKKTLNKLKKELNKDIERLQTEFNGFEFFILNDLPIDNLIYCPHEKRFCIGWIFQTTKEEQEIYKEKLKEFKFEYYFK